MPFSYENFIPGSQPAQQSSKMVGESGMFQTTSALKHIKRYHV